MELKEKLFDLLKTNKDFVDKNNELLIDKILFKENEKQLITLLLSDEEIKKIFFNELQIDNNETLIFKRDDFIFYLKTKNYLKDSWTQFKNKIGFKNENQLDKNIVLDFPYKDCILVGGQTKDEEKEKEVFLNEILCKDEIKRIFEPKVFTNYQKITKNGDGGFLFF